MKVNDTQSGLRGIPFRFMKELIDCKGERFEYEMQMLLECAGRYDLTEVPIQTIYESKENHQTHFKPIRDSFRIYKILGKKFLKFIFSSLSSFVVDIILFYLFVLLFKEAYPALYVTIATVSARVISAVYNYLINYKFVFKSKASRSTSLTKYALLAVIKRRNSKPYRFPHPELLGNPCQGNSRHHPVPDKLLSPAEICFQFQIKNMT